MDEKIAQFVSVTGTTAKEAKKFLTKYKRVDLAINAYYSAPQSVPKSGASTSKIQALFDGYRDPDEEEIGVEGTIKFCADLDVDPEDVALLAVAYELKSPAMGQWTKKGWTDGWKALDVDTIPAMKSEVEQLKTKLGSDPEYFKLVYNYTFDFSRASGQRSLPLELALGFWAILIPHGLSGGALAHLNSRDEDDDEDMGQEGGWDDKYTEWWFEYLKSAGVKGVSKDVWQMFFEFVRTIDAKFEKYDAEAAWPSTIDDFVEHARAKVAGGA